MARFGDPNGDIGGVQPGARCINGHEAEPGLLGSRFCTICGAPMMVRCPNGHEVVAAAHCTVCGLPLMADTGIPEAETTAETVALGPTDPAPKPPRRPWLTIAGVVLLVLLVGGGAYFGVSSLTGSDGEKSTGGQPVNATSAIATQSSSPSTVTSTPPPTVTLVAPSTVTAAPPTTVTVKPPVVTAPPTVTSTGDVVNAYFAAINAGDYPRAWALGGANIQGGSYTSFVQGFASTTYDAVTILSVTGETATIELDALQSDGTHRHFAGTYTVRGGVIVAANVRQTAG
jgi:hypothetical protein